MFFLLEKQIPMAVVSPGKQPKTRAERDRVTESGAEVLFNESDLNDIYKQGFPVVIGFNNRNHNCPTVIIPPSDYNYWKVQHIESILKVALDQMKDLDYDSLPSVINTSLKAITNDVNHLSSLLGQAAPAPPAVTVAGDKAIGTGPLFRQLGFFTQKPPTPAAPGPAAPAPPNDPPVPATPANQKDKTKNFTCDKCGKEKTKKSDLEYHLAFKHNIGEQQRCHLGDCNGKLFSAPNNLKLHQRNMHKGEYNYSCEVCSYKTNSKGNFDGHMKKHRGDPKEHVCSKCQKHFYSAQSLARHIKRDTCTLTKNFECTQCKPSSWFLKKESLETHIKQSHTGEIKKYKCSIPNCQQECVTKGSLKTHMDWHVKIKALEVRREEELRKRKQGAEKLKIKKRKKISKSAPAKVVPERR